MAAREAVDFEAKLVTRARGTNNSARPTLPPGSASPNLSVSNVSETGRDIKADSDVPMPNILELVMRLAPFAELPINLPNRGKG